MEDQIYDQIDDQINYVKFLSNYDKNILKWYTDGTEYKEFNKCIRNNLFLCSDYIIYKQKLKDIFFQAPPTTSDIIVYRGMGRPHHLDKNDMDPLSYIHTSLHVKSAVEFANEDNKCCLYQILVKKGSKILPVRKISEHYFEDEIILDKNGKILCKDITYIFVNKIKYTIYNCVYHNNDDVDDVDDVNDVDDDVNDVNDVNDINDINDNNEKMYKLIYSNLIDYIKDSYEMFNTININDVIYEINNIEKQLILDQNIKQKLIKELDDYIKNNYQFGKKKFRSRSRSKLRRSRKLKNN